MNFGRGELLGSGYSFTRWKIAFRVYNWEKKSCARFSELAECRIFGACCWKSLDSIDLKVLCVELMAKTLRKGLGMDWA